MIFMGQKKSIDPILPPRNETKALNILESAYFSWIIVERRVPILNKQEKSRFARYNVTWLEI